jgi:DNA-binding transcriptional ArsR family regulator
MLKTRQRNNIMVGKLSFINLSFMDDKGWLDEVFLNKERTLILEILLTKKSINVAKLMKISRLKFAEVMFHLLAFEKMGLVSEKVEGADRIFSLIIDNSRVRALQKLKSCWNEDDP